MEVEVLSIVMRIILKIGLLYEWCKSGRRKDMVIKNEN